MPDAGRNHFFFVSFYCSTVVTQYYEADVNKEHVIRGNSAVIKCLIPSFVADFVEVVSWHTDQDETFYPDSKFGSLQLVWLQLLLSS